MSDNRPRNDAAMAEILSSIRRIVAEEDRRGPQRTVPGADDDVLVLTAEMRLPDDAPPAPPEEAFTLSPEEAMIADVARAVLRDELDGEIGRLLQRRIRDTVRQELRRALDELRAGRP